MPAGSYQGTHRKPGATEITLCSNVELFYRTLKSFESIKIKTPHSTGNNSVISYQKRKKRQAEKMMVFFRDAESSGNSQNEALRLIYLMNRK